MIRDDGPLTFAFTCDRFMTSQAKCLVSSCEFLTCTGFQWNPGEPQTTRDSVDNNSITKK